MSRGECFTAMAHSMGDKQGMDADQIMEFRNLALLELKRAERYRNFLSLLVLNLSEFLATAGKRKINSPDAASEFVEKAVARLRAFARETDMISRLGEARLVMLLPETDPSGARTAAGRFQKLIADYLAEFLESDFRFEVSLEIASFPDSSGEASLKSRLKGLFASN